MVSSSDWNILATSPIFNGFMQNMLHVNAVEKNHQQQRKAAALQSLEKLEEYISASPETRNYFLGLQDKIASDYSFRQSMPAGLADTVMMLDLRKEAWDTKDLTIEAIRKLVQPYVDHINSKFSMVRLEMKVYWNSTLNSFQISVDSKEKEAGKELCKAYQHFTNMIESVLTNVRKIVQVPVQFEANPLLENICKSS